MSSKSDTTTTNTSYSANKPTQKDGVHFHPHLTRAQFDKVWILEFRKIYQKPEDFKQTAAWRPNLPWDQLQGREAVFGERPHQNGAHLHPDVQPVWEPGFAFFFEKPKDFD